MNALDKNADKPLYEQLYENIKSDILSGKMSEGEKLPSKRALSERLRVSVITVENAYSQLIAEGYVRAAERSGYFVQYSGGAVKLPTIAIPDENVTELSDGEQPETRDEDAAAQSGQFPFSVWTRLMRSVILEKGTTLLRPVPCGGAEELRRAISGYLYRARGFYQPPSRIIAGAGTEYLYNMLIQLLGRDKRYGIEDPSYEKLAKIYALNDVAFEYLSLDDSGMIARELYEKRVDAAHISPAHHYPTGIVMPISRRREIMRWAEEDKRRFIIEDDYDSELRWSGKPLPTMFGSDTTGRVIYMNTFSQTIAPSVRISYMCLSEELYELWREKLGFYACPVPAFEQYTLARFISEGYFERHINRSKKRFRRIRDLVLRLISRYLDTEVFEENAGLHFTVSVGSAGDNAAMIEACRRCGIRVTPLADYYAVHSCNSDLYVVNYGAADEEKLSEILKNTD